MSNEQKLREIYRRHELATTGLVMSDFERIAKDITTALALPTADHIPDAGKMVSAKLKPLPFAVFDEFGKSCDDRVQDHYYDAIAAQPQVQELPDPTLSALMGQDVTREQWERFKHWGAQDLPDRELPGMWHTSDLTGGATDCEQQPRGAWIKATLHHDAGAYAQCGDCGRYSDDPKTLSNRPPACDCGETHAWSGSPSSRTLCACMAHWFYSACLDWRRPWLARHGVTR